MSDGLITDLARELRELEERHPSIVLSLSPREAFSLIGVLQLALRHPGMGGAPRDVAERVKVALAGAIGSTPALHQVIRLGDDPAYDLSRETL